MSWAFEMQKLSGELPIEKLVDYTYELCERAAEDAGKNEDLVLDLCRVTDDDLRFSEVMFNSVVAWQDAYFGQMLQDSWENADKAFVPRVKRSKNADAYIMLPQ